MSTDNRSEMRKILDALMEIGPLTLEDLLENEPSDRSDEQRQTIAEGLQAALKRWK